MAQARKALLVRNVGMVAWLSGLVKNERETYKGNLIVENSVCFVLKIELFLGVLSNFKWNHFLYCRVDILMDSLFGSYLVLRYLIYGRMIINLIGLCVCVCLFWFLYYSPYRGVRYRIWSSACKADEADFADFADILPTN